VEASAGPGRHRLEWLDERGRVREAVGFEVRGAPLRAQSTLSP
jgi:hypothetical protein